MAGGRARNYEEEYVSFLERATDDWDNFEALRFDDAWDSHVRDFIMGTSGNEIPPEMESFAADAFGFFHESISSAGFRMDETGVRFRDVETGRFVSRDTIRELLRHIPFFGRFTGGSDDEPL